jgi:hypothetical protein
VSWCRDYNPKANPAKNIEYLNLPERARAAYEKHDIDAEKIIESTGWTLEGHWSLRSACASLFKNATTGQYVLAFRRTEISERGSERDRSGIGGLGYFSVIYLAKTGPVPLAPSMKEAER